MRSLLSHLVSYWPLHEASGSRYDVVGAGNTLADTNTVTQGNGIQVAAASFARANSERLDLSSNALIQTGDIDWTWCFWCNFASKPAGVMSIINKYAATSGNAEYYIYWNNSTDRLMCDVYRATDSAQQVSASNFGGVTAGVWNFVAVWHDAAADTINIEINNGVPNSQATGGALQAAGSAALAFGGNAGIGLYYDGLLSEAALWKRVLTRQERAWLYNSGRGRTYPFDGRISPMLSNWRDCTTRLSRATGGLG